MIETIFESKKINYCTISHDLIDDYLAMVNDDSINQYISKKPQHYTKEEEMQWLKDELEKNSVIFSMVDKKSNKFIGNIELRNVNKNLLSAELGICITASMVDLGYGTEAIAAILRYGFETLGLITVSLAVYSFNLRAIHCYEKLGFIKTDTHFNVGINNNVSFDEHTMTINKKDFLKYERR